MGTSWLLVQHFRDRYLLRFLCGIAVGKFKSPALKYGIHMYLGTYVCSFGRGRGRGEGIDGCIIICMGCHNMVANSLHQIEEGGRTVNV
eukprot:scaffold6286_cov82-Skeletonema_menzelii.AAC.3